MGKIMKHPFSGALYEVDIGGNVMVREGKIEGLFDSSGRWLSGELRQADPQLCVWITNNPPSPLNARKTHHIN
ncbi:MAG: hypothetical protein FJ194_06960 [Gammaproteobacteria bacterium]|nr:hypothetical protein [Gammaproteobacteria bacterium]